MGYESVCADELASFIDGRGRRIEEIGMQFRENVGTAELLVRDGIIVRSRECLGEFLNHACDIVWGDQDAFQRKRWNR